jgi:hypothetical protein
MIIHSLQVAQNQVQICISRIFQVRVVLDHGVFAAS